MRAIVKLSPLAVIIVVIAFTVGILESDAFHKSADAGCNACHIMHASRDGVSRTPQPHLIAVEGDGCLACHGSSEQGPSVYQSSTELPGGDYGNVVVDYTRGHNPSDGSETIPSDPILGRMPPGGIQELNNWTCNECHDTSNGFDFRLLRKDPGHLGNPLDESNFTATNADEAVIWDGFANVEHSFDNHNIYRGFVGDEEVGFGKWCATCHPNFHGEENLRPLGDWLLHPTENSLSQGIINVYGNNYDYLYPLETMNSEATTVGTWPISELDDGITCLTCHKAHASDYPDALRWDNEVSTEGCDKCH